MPQKTLLSREEPIFTPERIKAIRAAYNESQAVFAERIGVSSNMLARWEQGTATPRRYRAVQHLLDVEEAITD